MADDWEVSDTNYNDVGKISSDSQQNSTEDAETSVISHYSQSPALQLDSICRKMPFLSQVIIVGQKAETLEGIDNLGLLTELWVVEAQLKDADAAARCPHLTKLMLYSNDLVKVPPLGSLPKLKSLWLAGNKIKIVENLDKLTELQDLNIAKNVIKSLGDSLRNNKQLTTLNIAGNPITHFKETIPLQSLPNLTSLLIADSLYGPAPVARLCNYRSAVLLLLPTLKLLDGFSITSDERHQVSEFYDAKMRKVRAVAYHLREKATESIRDVIRDWSKDLKYLRESTMLLLQRKNDKKSQSSQTEGQGLTDLRSCIHRWNTERDERVRHIRAHVQVQTAQLECAIQQAGNVFFAHHSEGSHLANICQDLLNRVSCATRLRLSSSSLTFNARKSTNVSNSTIRPGPSPGPGPGPPRSGSPRPDEAGTGSTHQAAQIPVGSLPTSNQSSSVENMLLLLTNAERDLRYGSWPLLVTDTSQYWGNGKDHGIYVTNCLAAADLGWLKRLSVARGAAGPDTAAVSETKRFAAIVRLRRGVYFRRVPDAGCSGHCAKCITAEGSVQCKCRCRVYRVTGTKPQLIFLIEFVYQFKVGTRSPKSTWWRAMSIKLGPGVLNENVLSSCINKPRCEWGQVERINASARGVSVLGELPEMKSVRVLDLSHNVLISLGSLYAFPNLRELNLRANNLVTLVNMRSLPHLVVLDISWNSIRRIIPILQCLNKYTPALTSLMVSHNPTEDILDEEQLLAVSLRYLPHLEKVDNRAIKPATYLAFPGLPGEPNNDPAFYPLTLKWRASCVPCGHTTSEGTVLNASNRLLRGLLPSDLWASVRSADLSGNLLDDQDIVHVFNTMINIEEITLARNAILHIPLNTFQSCPKLTRLDLSNNFLTSVGSFALYPLIALRVLDLSNNQLHTLEGLHINSSITELYAANNLLSEMNLIQDSLRSLTDLKVLDLYGNPVATERSLLKLALFHLKKLESLNGMTVTDGDLHEAQQTFSGCLDRDALLRHFAWKDLSHLTELSLPRTHLRSVDLPGEILPVLASIDLSYNNITRLWGLHNLPSLRTLNLNDNQIKHFGGPDDIPEVIFPCLATLYLQNNSLKRLSELEMIRLRALRVIFLQGNRLADFRDVPHWVTGLIIDRNKISDIALPIFNNASTSHLTDLLLEGNNLSKLTFVSALQTLGRLFIARNRIQDEEQLFYLATLPRLRELTLQGNPVCQRKKHFSSLRDLLPDLLRLDGHIIDPKYYLMQRQSIKTALPHGHV